MSRFQPFIVTDIYGQTLEGLPTPMLISQGGGEAYEVDGIWRYRDDSYDEPGTKYTRVRIKHMKEYYVDLDVELIETGSDDADREPFRDTVYVVAESEAEARALAPGKAAEYWQEREGPNVAVSSTTIRVKDSPI